MWKDGSVMGWEIGGEVLYCTILYDSREEYDRRRIDMLMAGYDELNVWYDKKVRVDYGLSKW